MPSGHIDKAKPLRPLSTYAWAALEAAARTPTASHLYNAGVWNRLRREDLVEQVALRGSSVIYSATEAGRTKLARAPDAA